MTTAHRIAAILFLLLACAGLSAPPAQATTPHSRVSVDPVLYELVWEQVWVPAWYDYYGYHAGYYQWVKRYRAVKVERISYSLSYDAAASGIIDELRLLRKEVSALGAGAQQLRAADGLAILRRECASCHGAKVADKSGDGFVLLDEGGGLVPMGKGAAKRVAARVNTTDAAIRMPPGKQLGAEERAAIKGLMEGLGNPMPAAKE